MTYVEQIPLLSCEFEIRTNSREIMDRLSWITPRAQQDVPVVEHCTVTVYWTGDEFRIDIDGVNEDFELSVTSAVETLYQGLHRRAVAALPDHIRITAATGMHAGSAFLLVGPERAGKTTLALSLMLEGIEITGDQLALLRDGEALAFPRKFYAREESLSRLPRLRLFDKFSECINNPQQYRVVALDPLEFGKPWRITPTQFLQYSTSSPISAAQAPCGAAVKSRWSDAFCRTAHPPFQAERGGSVN